MSSFLKFPPNPHWAYVFNIEVKPRMVMCLCSGELTFELLIGD